MSETLERLWRCVSMMIGRGRIRLTNDAAGVQELQVQLSAAEVRDNAPRIAEFGFSSVPPAGSDAVLIFLGGERTEAIVIATNHQPSRPRNLAAGESIQYSQDGKYVKITASGGIIIETLGQGLTINGDVTVNGKVTATGDVKAGTISLETHVHSGVQAGSGNSGGPH